MVDMRANSNLGSTTGWIQRTWFNVPTSLYDGNWSGTTSQSKSVTMTVANGQITHFNTLATYVGPNCGGTTDLVEMFPATTVFNGNLAVFLTALAGGQGFANGTFSSATTVAGNLGVTVTGCGSANVSLSMTKD